MAKSSIVVPYYDGEEIAEQDLLVTQQATYVLLGETETHFVIRQIRPRVDKVSKQSILNQNPVLVKHSEVLKYQPTPQERARNTKK